MLRAYSRFLSILLLAAVCGSGGVKAAEPAAFELRLIQDGGRYFHVEAEALVKAPLAVVVDTLRDYDHVPEFVPTVVLSRRTRYQGQPVIEQIGRARFMGFSFKVHMLWAEDYAAAQQQLKLHAVAGDFSTFDVVWTFQQESSGTRLAFSAQAVLKRWIPQWLARRQLKQNVQISFAALIQEMERRARTH